MAYRVLNLNPADGLDPLLGWSRQDVPFVVELTKDQPSRGPRLQVFTAVPRSYRWPVLPARGTLDAWNALLASLGTVRDAFLLADPDDLERGPVTPEPAVGDGARVTFALPTAEASAEWPYYPLAGTARATVAGLVAGVASVDQDARTVTLAAAPAAAAAVRLWYRPLRLVRIVNPPQAVRPDPAVQLTDLELRELFRD